MIVITGLDTTTSWIYGRFFHKAVKKLCHAFNSRFCDVCKVRGM